MKDIQLRELHRNTAEYADKQIVVRGWVRTNRSSNKFGFIELNDGTFFKSVQVVYEADKIDNFDAIAKAPISSALMVEGTLVLTPDAKQPFEIKADKDGKLVWKCPNCGNTDQSKLNVARRTCGYIGTQFWNQGRTQEIKERVLHL